MPTPESLTRGGRLAGKVALVTGAGSGIGRAMTLLFAREGALVAAVDSNHQGLQRLAREAGAGASGLLPIPADVGVASDCEAAVGTTLESFQRLDVLCNNAGVILRASVIDTSESDWDRLMTVNVKSVYLMSRAALPIMIEQGAGTILNTASGWGLTGGPQAAAYCASKGAVVQLTKAMAVDHGPQGIRVNCICPGDTDTPMLRDEARQLDFEPDALLRAAADRPLQRVGSPAEIARAALYLVSDDASFVTGAVLVVDGGGLAGI